jgi:uncharacterized membrane protein YdjX (TVP38/TMEM64 family)
MSRTILAALLALLVVAHAVELSQTSEIELEANAEAEGPFFFLPTFFLFLTTPFSM